MKLFGRTFDAWVDATVDDEEGRALVCSLFSDPPTDPDSDPRVGNAYALYGRLLRVDAFKR